jgi:hypothetical protein
MKKLDYQPVGPPHVDVAGYSSDGSYSLTVRMALAHPRVAIVSMVRSITVPARQLR